MSIQQTNKQFDRDYQALAQYSWALEHFGQLLNGRDEFGDTESDIIRVTLESIDPDFSVGNSGSITWQDIKKGLAEAAKVVREMLRFVFDTLNSLYVKFTGSVTRVRNAQQKQSKRFGMLGSKVSSSKMTVSGIQRLSINGEFVGANINNLLDIEKTTTYMLETYPRSIVGLARNTSRKFLNVIETHEGHSSGNIAESAMSQFGNVLGTNFTQPPGATKVNSKELDIGNGDLLRGTVLPGNMAIVYSDPRSLIDEAVSNTNTVNVINKSLTMSFTELQLAIADRNEREISVPSVDEIGALLSGISRILSIAEKSKQVESDYTSVRTVVDDAIRQITEKVTDSGRDSNTLITMLGAISKKLVEPAGPYLHWLAVTLNVYLTFIGECITHYEQQGH